MIPFIEVLDRAFEGPYCPEQDFDMKILVPKLQELIQKYKVKFDPENPVSSDDDLADRVFRAGLELYAEVGTYCTGTERIIKFTESEILDALRTAPRETEYGEGNERKKMVPRRPESEVPPWCYIGACAIPVSSDEVFFSLMKGCASIALADSMTTPTILMIDGRNVRGGTPLEILACIRSVKLSREACQAAGRPGLPLMNSIATASSDVGKIGGGHFGLLPSDGWQIGALAELKINFQRLNEVQFTLSLGGNIIAEGGPLLGGYAGGPEGVAIVNVAYHLNSILVLRGRCHLTFPLHIRTTCSSSRDLLWAISVSSQAISRNSHFPFMTVPFTAAGPVEEMCFYEAAATVTNCVVSGSSLEALAIHGIVKTDLQSPVGSQFAAEVGHAVAGMTRKEANAIVQKLLGLYEDRIGNPPVGKRYQESYDVKTGKPFPETQRLYEEMKKKIVKLGINLKA